MFTRLAPLVLLLRTRRGLTISASPNASAQEIAELAGGWLASLLTSRSESGNGGLYPQLFLRLRTCTKKSISHENHLALPRRFPHCLARPLSKERPPRTGHSSGGNILFVWRDQPPRGRRPNRSHRPDRP